MSRFSPMPSPPYYAVIFSNQMGSDTEGYGQMSDLMVSMSADQPGFIGIETTRDAGGFGITVSYWESEAAIANWRENAKHQAAQQKGKVTWYDRYQLRVAKVERQYDGPQDR